MPLPDSSRARAELALRGIAAAAMLGLAARLWSGGPGRGAVATITSASLDSALASWTISAPQSATLTAAPLPDPGQRDWLVALRRTGVTVEWRPGDSAQLAMVAEAGVLPRQPARLVTLGTPAATIHVADDLGALDSTNTGDDGVVSWQANSVGPATATIRGASASAEPRDSLSTNPVLVVGQAGWETKFVMAALEESGWPVSSRVTIAPGAIVRQASAPSLDTASYGAVVVLDSISALPAVTRFVRDGGGLVAAGAGVNHPALRAILPRAAGTIPAEIGALLGPTPKEGLQARRLRADSGTVTLERRGSEPTVLAHRVGMGKVVAVGYDDTWRLRMAPPDESAPEGHRAWWSSLVAGVARVSLARRETGTIDEAPRAATIVALGAPAAGQPRSHARSIPWTTLLAALAGLSLLVEWLSRRLRGMA